MKMRAVPTIIPATRIWLSPPEPPPSRYLARVALARWSVLAAWSTGS